MQEKGITITGYYINFEFKPNGAFLQTVLYLCDYIHFMVHKRRRT
jgi:hypothetical protein